jgi:hypothetical protein
MCELRCSGFGCCSVLASFASRASGVKALQRLSAAFLRRYEVGQALLPGKRSKPVDGGFNAAQLPTRTLPTTGLEYYAAIRNHLIGAATPDTGMLPARALGPS